MPPKKKPVQAGKFKPLKRPTKKAASAAAAESNPSTSSSEAAAVATSTTTTSSDNNVAASSTNTTTKTQRSARSKSPKGRGGGGRGGRGGRGGGRGGGRFIAPTGQAFFTGNAMPGGGSAAAAGTRAARGRRGPAVDPSNNNNSVVAPKYTATRHAAESAAAAARAKEGEGEEIVVMEMDLEDGHDSNNKDDQPRKKKGVLEQQERPIVRDGPSLYDDELLENTHQETVVFHGDAYEYDSDSSIEEEKQQQGRNNDDDGRPFRMAPMRLPFPVAPHQQSMYDCQAMIENEEKKSSEDADMTTSTSSHQQQSSSKLSDPVLESPFIDVNSASDEMKQLESNSWFLMKFPTRLPHVDVTGRSTSSSSGSKRSSANVKKEMSEGGHDGPDMIGSSIDMNDIMLSSSGSTARGYDDTLKDMPPGKYGRIIVRKSGKTELVIGGGDSGEPEVRMLIHEGLQCGFRQEAVSIDPDEATFVPLGNIKKSIVVTPDVLGNGL